MSGMAISQFYIINSRGDTIIQKEFRGDVPKGTSEIFFRKVKFWKGDPPPVFNVDGINYLFIKKGGLFFVATTKFNVSPSLVLELLDRTTKIFKDYCGVLTEESVRKNFILIYELVDEILDYGYPQTTSTEALKMYVHTEPVAVDAARGAGASGGAGSAMSSILSSKKTISSSAVLKPISLSTSSTGSGKNEIFVDILERLTVVFNPNGYILNSMIDGCIQMKSYLSGNPALRLALNEDLVVGKENASGYAGVVLDDCNFHECVNLDDFESTRTLALIPPDGEFVVMNYRVTSEFRAPFRIFPVVEETSPYKLELLLKVRADIPEANYGTNVIIRFPVPKHATTVVPELGPGATAAAPKGVAAVAVAAAAGAGASTGSGQSAEYSAKDREVVWAIKKFGGGQEHTLRTKITLSTPSTTNIRKELGPIAMSFEIPMYNVSNLAVKYLRIAEADKRYKPYRWVRYVATSNSYVCRL